jgi:hypothetical protein
VSWFSRWGKPDPYAKPAVAGARFGVFVVVAMATPHPHYGFRARVRCALCGGEREVLLARVRHSPPANHRGCNAPRERRAEMGARLSAISGRRLSIEAHNEIERIAKSRGILPAAQVFRTSRSVIDRVLGPGIVRAATAERLEERARELAAARAT